MINVRLANHLDNKKWDDYVLAHENAGPYHLFAWKKAIEAEYGHSTYYFIAQDKDGNTTGVLPLVNVKPPLCKATLVSQPFCDYGGILASNEESAKLLLENAIELARLINAKIEIRCTEQEIFLDSSLALNPVSNKTRMILELPDTSAQLWDSFKSKLRSQIRRPQKDGLNFELGTFDKIEDFYQVFCHNMRDLGSPVHAKSFIKAVIKEFSENIKVGVVYKDRVPLAAGIILMCGKTVSIPWASSLREYNRFSPNMLLYWEFLEYACEKDFSHFDFGRSTPGEGTYKFKEQWGAQPRPLYWYKEGSPHRKKTELTDGKARELIEKVWAKIPLSIVNYLGPSLRKYITL